MQQFTRQSQMRAGVNHSNIIQL